MNNTSMIKSYSDNGSDFDKYVEGENGQLSLFTLEDIEKMNIEKGDNIPHE